MKYLLLGLVLVLASSCIPLRIAPTIDNYKLIRGRKFKKNLPRDNAFIFEDPKEANEFYNFINTKYSLNHQTVEYNVPIIVDGSEFFLTFYEVEISDKSINLLPAFANAAMENKGITPVFNDPQVKRKGNWYLALFVYDSNMNDCLGADYSSKMAILNHLKSLKKEYLNTSNYLEAMMKMN